MKSLAIIPTAFRGSLIAGWVPSLLLVTSAIVVTARASTAPRAAGPMAIDLADRLTAHQLRAVNRTVTLLGGTRGVHVSEQEGPGVVWIEGTDVAQGTIAVDVRGRDVLQRSFLGVAFHRRDDETYEAVYLRPFNFRAADAGRHQHAVQYISVPAFDWSKLRQDSPEEFENPVDASIVPTAWVPLRVVIKDRSVQIFVGTIAAPTLEVRKLGTLDRGQVGLWVGNNSDGDFANLVITK